ncbi:MAG TPA: VWA domain-containing protein [Thermoanaerobaculia bacterium]|nr:VWA domain-containing protein [Thermoanaerobaculia bacterium]
MRSLRLALALLTAALPAAAWQPPPPAAEPPASIFGEQIEVRVVNVEVVVTDKDGNRVSGLAPSDFLLKVDGKTVPVAYFSEVRGGQAIVPGAAPAGEPLPGLPSLAPGTAVGTSYLVFIDDFFSMQPRRNEVLRSLKDQLTRIRPEDRMAVVAYDGRSLDMLSTWSSSERVLSRALDQALGRPSYGVQRLAELRSFDTTQRMNASIGVVPNSRSALSRQLDIEEVGYAGHLAEQVRRAVDAAASTLRGFASPPGRKVMLLLSGGWPYSPADYAVNDFNRVVGSTREVPRGEELLRPLTDTANLLGYTIYSVDVPGLESTGPDASEASPENATGLNLREQEVHQALEYVAAGTGGKALLNSLREKALPTAESDTRSYYWLGFTPGWQKNDQRHKVDVEVTRPGLRVRSRDSFLDLSKKSEVSMMVESAMLFGSPPGATPMPIKLGAQVKQGRKEILLPITLAIPVSGLTVVPLEGKHVAEMELRVAAVDENGDRSEIPVVPLRMTLEQAPPPEAYLRYDTKIRLRKIQQHLIVAIFDPLSGHIMTAEADVKPEPKK